MSPGSKSNGIVSDGLKEKLMDEILHLSDVDIAPPIHPLQYDDLQPGPSLQTVINTHLFIVYTLL